MPRFRTPNVNCFTLLTLSALLSACSTQHAARPEPASANNVILFIGDGMGVSTVTAGRIYEGQARGMSGEEYELSFERFPEIALVKTYNTNQQVPDSAGTATAMLTGVKTRAGVINISGEPLRGDCEAGAAHGLTSLATIAHRQGLRTGVVTTARLTHATPATMYAQAADRNWESDRYLASEQLAAGCRDIARQLIDDDHGADLVVALGGGSRSFYGAASGGVRQTADADLPGEWLAAGGNRRFVTTAAELEDARPGERVLGLFAHSHMTYMVERGPRSSEPTLTEMTLKALDLLENGGGYFLMVEGGRIDHGHHDGRPGYALEEFREFNRAVDAVIDRVNVDDTLLLVTADHSHVFTMGGYPTRGNPILGLVTQNDRSGRPKPEPERAEDGKPYTTLGYYNGPGAVGDGPRPTPDTGVEAIAQALVPIRHLELDGSWTYDESHGGEDVPLYGIGPGSERIGGVIEQNLIFDIMSGAFGWTDAATVP